MSISKTVFKTSLIYFIGQVLTKLIAFVLLPLYTNYITKADFGYYDLVTSVLGVVVPVIFMEIWTGALRFALEEKDDLGKRKAINNSLVLAFISFLVYTLIYGICAAIFNFRLPVWIYVYSMIWILQLIFLNSARVYGKNTLYASSGVISVFINAIVTIIAVKMLNGNLTSLFIGIICGTLIQDVMIESKLKTLRNFKISDFDKDFCYSLIRFSFPLSINSIVYWMLEGFNKIVISGKLGIAANGVYSVGNRLSTILNLILQVFLLAWQETIFKISSNEEKEQIYTIGFNLMIKVIGGGIIILLPLIFVFFSYLIGENYSSAKNLVPFLLLVIFVNALSGLLTSCFAAEKDNKSALYTKCASCIINGIILLSTIDKIGLFASPLALFFANFVGIILQLIVLKKHILVLPNYKSIYLFMCLFFISLLIYIKGNIAINLTWFICTSIFYSIYLKDFISKIYTLAFKMICRKG